MPITAEPNVVVFMWIFGVIIVMNSFINIIDGIRKKEVKKFYGGSNVAIGIIQLFILSLVFIL